MCVHLGALIEAFGGKIAKITVRDPNQVIVMSIQKENLFHSPQPCTVLDTQIYHYSLSIGRVNLYCLQSSSCPESLSR